MDIPFVKKPENIKRIVEGESEQVFMENAEIIDKYFPEDKDENKRVHAADLDTTQIILEDIHKKEHILSLSNFTAASRDSYLRLAGFNQLAKNPLIGNYLDTYADMNRSLTDKPVSMLRGLFDIAVQAIGQTETTLMKKMGMH